MSCECYKIGGRFIAEDPDCLVHGREAVEERERVEKRIRDLEDALRDCCAVLGGFELSKGALVKALEKAKKLLEK